MAIAGSTASTVTRVISVTKALEAAAEYAANDVLSETDTNTEGTCWTFEYAARVNGGSGCITTAAIISESESVTPQITLYLFNATPTSELDDNAANTAPDSADLAKFVGKIDFPSLESLGTTDSMATVTPNTPGGIPLEFKCASTSSSLFGIAVTRTVFTQTAGDDLTIVLTVEQK